VDTRKEVSLFFGTKGNLEVLTVYCLLKDASLTIIKTARLIFCQLPPWSPAEQLGLGKTQSFQLRKIFEQNVSKKMVFKMLDDQMK